MAQYQESKPSDWLEGDRSLPLLSFSTRKINDGQLLHTSRYVEKHSPSQCDLEPAVLLALLSDCKAVFKQNMLLPPRKSKFKEWVEKISDWLHLPSQRELYFINTETGICENTLTTTVEAYSAHLLSGGHLLALTCAHNDGLFLVKYDYPLHKPWYLIFSWAFGLAAITLILCQSILAFKRRRKGALR